MLQLTRHYDPGHSWLQVPKVIVRGLGKEVCDSISFYSFQDRDNLYLEEDEDMYRVLEPLKKSGLEFKIIEKNHEEAPCRNFKRVNC